MLGVLEEGSSLGLGHFANVLTILFCSIRNCQDVTSNILAECKYQILFKIDSQTLLYILSVDIPVGSHSIPLYIPFSVTPHLHTGHNFCPMPCYHQNIHFKFLS